MGEVDVDQAGADGDTAAREPLRARAKELWCTFVKAAGATFGIY